MGTVTIEFHGVCVHVRRMPWRNDLPDGVDHRVVVIDNRHERVVNEHTIAPHIPRVEVYDEQPREGLHPRESFLLDRLQLWIAGAEPGLPVPDENFRCVIPPLGEFVSDLQADPGVVVQGRETAGFVDLSGGSIRGEIRHNGAGVAIFESPLSDGAVLQTLHLDTGIPNTIMLPADVWIIVSNVGGNEEDRDADFLLNYLISGSVPPKAPILDKRRNCGVSPSSGFPFFSIGPGCSNTQYP